jgi:hypothetical protein
VGIPAARLQRASSAAVAALGLTFGTFLALTMVPQLHLTDPDHRHPLLVGLHRAHDDLNAAVGYGRWEPAELDGTATRLRVLAVRYDNAAVILEDAASQIDQAVERGERADAVLAHRIVDGLERRVRAELRRERERLRLPLG